MTAPSPMPDLVSIIVQTYRLVWAERFYILHIATVPFLVIYINYMLVELAAPEALPLRRGLYLFPAMIAEGWLVAQFLRTLLTRERWPMPPLTGPNDPNIRHRFARARALLAGILFYTLISLGTNATAGVMATLMPVQPGQTPPVTPPSALGWMMAWLILVLSQFRLLWLHIPMLQGQNVYTFIRRSQIWILNFQLVAVWLLSVVPVFLALVVVVKPLVMIEPSISVFAFALTLVTAFIHVAAQLIISIVASTAITIALQPFLNGANNGR